MKTKLLFLVILLMGCLTLTAQTTHFIDWDLSVGANATITIDVGDTIEWEHTDPGMPHDVVSNDPNAPTGFGSAFMNFGDTYSFTFTSPIVFDYGCGIHPGSMDGTITVLAAVVCDPPTNLNLNNVTTTTANISWTASASETNGYNWVVMNMGDNPNTATPVTSGSVGTGVTTTSITGLTADTMYQIYVRTNCGTNGLSNYSNALHVQTDAACDPPTGLMLNSVTETTADISWTASTSETNGYNWVVMNMGDNPNTATPVTNGSVGTGITTASITGLTADTMYHVYVQTNCGANGLSVFSSVLHVQTDEEVLVCDAPSGLALDDISPTTATISWTASATETNGYEWVLFYQGDDPLTDPFVEDGGTATGVTEAMISGLDETTSYDFYVRSNCGANGLSDWAGPFTFTTDTTAGLNDNKLNGFVFYPNPASGIIYMQAHDDIQKVVIYNLLGQKVILHQATSNITELDVSGLANGTYLLKVSNSNNDTGFYKLLKQ